MRGIRRHRDELLVADFFVLHQLAVNDVHIAARFPKQEHANVTFIRWTAFFEPVAAGSNLIPDGYVELATGEEVIASFIEVDFGTESLRVWREKTEQYLRLATSGAFQELFQQPRFRVLVLANSERRLRSIRKTVSLVTEKIFRFATIENARKDFFGTHWLKPVAENHQPFFENHP